MKATLVIVNYQGCHLLERSLPAALAAAGRGGPHPVVVADDGSTDDSIEFVSRTYPEARVLARPRRGFAATCNAAVEAAETEAVVLLNNDVFVSPDFLSPLLDDLTKRDVFAVGCKFTNPDGSLANALGNRTSGRWRSGLLHIHHETRPALLTETCPQLYANGAAMAFLRDRWLALGGFDSLYHPFYWEDVDIGYRAWGRGWEVLYEPASLVVHEQGSTVRRVHEMRYIELMSARNAVLFCWKNLLEPRLFASAVAAQARWAADDTLIGGLPPRTASLFAALQQLRQAGIRRRREQRVRVRPDREILALASEGGR
jgi:GT2 family glycosyltransferase